MPDLLVYRYVGGRDAAGVPLASLAHPLHGALPARDLYQSDLAPLHPELVAMAEESALYAKPNQAEARQATREREESYGEGVSPGNVSSPGLPVEQRVATPPPGSDAAAPTGEVPAGPPIDAEMQADFERAAAAVNPAVQENPPVDAPRRSGKER